MCGRLRTKYSDCGCIRAENTVRCEVVEDYLGNTCPRYQGVVIRVPGSCPTHLEAGKEVEEKFMNGDAGGNDLEDSVPMNES